MVEASRRTRGYEEGPKSRFVRKKQTSSFSLFRFDRDTQEARYPCIEQFQRYHRQDSRHVVLDIRCALEFARQCNFSWIVLGCYCSRVYCRCKCSQTAGVCCSQFSVRRSDNDLIAQFMPVDPSLPPLVFHWFPFIGSSIHCAW